MERQIVIFILVNILLQNCVVYQKTSVPIDSAINKGKVKLISTDGRKIHFQKIEKEDSLYYGTLKSGKWPIPVAEVESIYMIDKKGSNILTWIIVPLAVGITITIIIVNNGFYG